MSVILYLIEKASVNNFENGHKGEQDLLNKNMVLADNNLKLLFFCLPMWKCSTMSIALFVENLNIKNVPRSKKKTKN